MSQRRRSPALLALASLACQQLTDPALPPGATLLTPPAVYARWWAMTEACSGITGNMSAVTWYVATGSPSIANGNQSDLAGYFSPVSNRIVLADTADLDGSAIRHEMLHALLGRSVSGHPRDQFLGRCAGSVTCDAACITDAGPPPPPDPAAVPASPSVLVVTGLVEPAAPSRAVDDGWFTFTIFVKNTRTTPVIATLAAPSGDAGSPISFRWQADCVPLIETCAGVIGSLRDERVDDEASVTRFAPGETKRFVVDFLIGRPGAAFWGISPGSYAFTGFYNGRITGPRSAPDTVVIAP